MRIGIDGVSDLVDDVLKGGGDVADADVECLVQLRRQFLDVGDELLLLAEGVHHLESCVQLAAVYPRIQRYQQFESRLFCR